MRRMRAWVYRLVFMVVYSSSRPVRLCCLSQPVLQSVGHIVNGGLNHASIRRSTASTARWQCSISETAPAAEWRELLRHCTAGPSCRALCPSRRTQVQGSWVHSIYSSAKMLLGVSSSGLSMTLRRAAG